MKASNTSNRSENEFLQYQKKKKSEIMENIHNL